MIELDAEQVLHVRPFLSVTAGIVVLFVGKALNERLAALRKYNIPEPVTGGLLFSVAFGMVYLFSGVKVDFELTARDILLVYFFTVIGINAHVGDLVRGGKPLAVLLAVTVAFMFAENLVGVGAARILGLDPSVGLLAAQHLDDRGARHRDRLGARHRRDPRGRKRNGDRRRLRDHGARPGEPCRGPGRPLPDPALPARGAAGTAV